MKAYTFYENAISAGLPVVLADVETSACVQNAVMLGTGDLRLSVLLDRRFQPDIINGRVYDAGVWEDEIGKSGPMGTASVALIKPDGESAEILLKVVGLGYQEWTLLGARIVAAAISRHADFNLFTDALVRMKPGDSVKLERDDGSQTIIRCLPGKLEIETMESPRADPYTDASGDEDDD